MALSHFKNSTAAVNKYEVVNPALFEVTILPPTLDGTNDNTTQLLLEHVISISGLDGLNPAMGTVVQKYKQADRVYLGVPDTTHLELGMTFSLNLNDANENYIYTSLRKWYNKAFNPATGAYGLKKDYCGSMVIVEYNRDGSIWRKTTAINVIPGQPTGMNDRNINSGNEANELSMTFIADCWTDNTVGLPTYE
jgi:hypothetical protein